MWVLSGNLEVNLSFKLQLNCILFCMNYACHLPRVANRREEHSLDALH